MTAYCEHCGQKIRNVWSHQTILQALQAWNEKYGSPPKAPQWRKATLTHPSNVTVADWFGSWNEGLRAAGLPFKPRFSGWTEETIVAACRAWYLQHGRKPRQREWGATTDLQPHYKIVTKRFGTWSAMIRASRLHELNIPKTMPTSALAAVVAPLVAKESSQRDLAARAGITEKALWRILSGETETTRKDLADRLLVAIDRPDAWHIELAEWAA